MHNYIIATNIDRSGSQTPAKIRRNEEPTLFYRLIRLIGIDTSVNDFNDDFDEQHFVEDFVEDFVEEVSTAPINERIERNTEEHWEQLEREVAAIERVGNIIRFRQFIHEQGMRSLEARVTNRIGIEEQRERSRRLGEIYQSFDSQINHDTPLNMEYDVNMGSDSDDETQNQTFDSNLVTTFRDIAEEAASVAQDRRVPLTAIESVGGTQNPIQQPPDDIPNQFLCPITLEIMGDPVTVSDGFTYERSAISRIMVNNIGVSPLTREDLIPGIIIPNINLRQLIQEYIASSSH
jgi:hypothetical protein